MAASSPASNSERGGDGIATPQKIPSFDQPKVNSRVLNKPRCIRCGNFARARCPFQSCQNCCAQDKNPCHVHVLKQNSQQPDKTPPVSSLSVEQQTFDTVLTSSSSRLKQLQQLPQKILHSIRTAKALGRKDAAKINKWRFAKLKEHMQGHLEAEGEAFDRYLRNVSFLEEIFSCKEARGDEMEIDGSETRWKLRSDSECINSFRIKIKALVDSKLQSLRLREQYAVDGNDKDVDGELKLWMKLMKERSRRAAAFDDVISNLVRVQSEDDLKPCVETLMKLLSYGKPWETSNDTLNILCPITRTCYLVQLDQDVADKMSLEVSSSCASEVVEL